MAACLRRPTQLLKSWYIGFFQIPRLPERVLMANNMRFLDNAFAAVPQAHMKPEDVTRYKEAMRQPGALTAMIGWYRALPGQMGRTAFSRQPYRVAAPTLVIWGEQDRYLHKACNTALPKYVNQLDIMYLPRASHWVQMHEPDKVNERMLAFFGPAEHGNGVE